MPNIEMHGFDSGAVQKTYDKLVGLFLDASYASKMVITGSRSGVRDLHGNLQPFLRICVTIESVAKYLPDMKERLADIGFDIEVSLLHEFISKKS